MAISDPQVMDPMHYLIDGHNLIGRMPDISLADANDEIELVLRLRRWAARARQRRVTVIFDHGLPGGTDKALTTTGVHVIFAAAGQQADSMLIARIRSAKNPREFTLVTSDAHIIREAESRRMPVVRAEEFAPKLAPMAEKGKVTTASGDPLADSDRLLSEAEIEMWLDLFDADEQ